MESAKITSKGQITIPLRVRRKLNLNTGDRVEFVEKDDGFKIISTPKMTYEQALEILMQKLKEGEDSYKNEPTMTIEESMARLGLKFD